MKSVAVYLGSAPGCKDIYKGLAYELGHRIALASVTLVYGGAAVGTMGALAEGAASAGGRVIGVFPRGFLGTKEVRESGLEVVQRGLSEFITTADFAERKQVMEDLSDGCIVMPGSFGTLDEFFEALTLRQLGLHAKPIVLLNTLGFYDALDRLLRSLARDGFMSAEVLDAYALCGTPAEALRRAAAPAAQNGATRTLSDYHA